MKAATEKKILSDVRGSIDQDASYRKRDKAQSTTVLVIGAISIGLASLFYKFELVQPLGLMFLSGIGGACLMALALVNHSKHHMEILKPYIKVDEISKRLDEI